MTALDLDFDLTPDQVRLREETQRFAAEIMRPAAMELDGMSPEAVIGEGSPLRAVFKKAYSLGYHLRAFPPDLGGPGFAAMDSWVVGETMGWGNAGLSISLGVTSMPFRFAAMTGNPDLMRDVVRPYLDDTEGRYIGCWCATEPQHGSDLILFSGQPGGPKDIHFECTARRVGDEWEINGQKSAWVSNGTIATHALAFLCVDPSLGMAGTGIAVVPLNIPGVSRGKPLDKLGQRALNQGEIFFDGARIPRHYMLVEPGGMATAGDATLAAANAGMSTTFSGVARAAFEEALRYSQERVQGGVPIASHQLVQKRLFDMFTRLESARALSRLANRRLGSGKPTLHYSIAAKTYCTQAALDLASEAIQTFGGIGLAKGMLVEMLYRDARASLIEDGSNEVLALAGARYLFGD